MGSRTVPTPLTAVAGRFGSPEGRLGSHPVGRSQLERGVELDLLWSELVVADTSLSHAQSLLGRTGPDTRSQIDNILSMVRQKAADELRRAHIAQDGLREAVRVLEQEMEVDKERHTYELQRQKETYEELLSIARASKEKSDIDLANCRADSKLLAKNSLELLEERREVELAILTLEEALSLSVENRGFHRPDSLVERSSDIRLKAAAVATRIRQTEIASDEVKSSVLGEESKPSKKTQIEMLKANGGDNRLGAELRTVLVEICRLERDMKHQEAAGRKGQFDVGKLTGQIQNLKVHCAKMMKTLDISRDVSNRLTIKVQAEAARADRAELQCAEFREANYVAEPHTLPFSTTECVDVDNGSVTYATSANDYLETDADANIAITPTNEFNAKLPPGRSPLNTIQFGITKYERDGESKKMPFNPQGADLGTRRSGCALVNKYLIETSACQMKQWDPRQHSTQSCSSIIAHTPTYHANHSLQSIPLQGYSTRGPALRAFSAALN